MHTPLRRVRHSIDILQKNFYEYHHGSGHSLSNKNIQSSQRCQKFIQLIEESCMIIQALFVRFIFIFSTVIAVWRLVEETNQTHYWYLLLLLIFLLIETYATVYTRKGYEYKWFCPSALAYLCAIVPCIWLLELNQSYDSLLITNQTMISLPIPEQRVSTSTTLVDLIESVENSSHSNETDLPDELQHLRRRKRLLSTMLTTTKKPDLSIDDVLKTTQDILIKLNKHLTIREWHMIIEQMTLLVLILSRWLLPKGEMTREELSQLLLVYIGIAADIIEFFEVFREKEVRTNIKLSVLVLLLWTFSLLQFCLAFTISRGRKSRLVIKEELERRFFCSPSDFWGMLMSLFLQDIPFFCFRAVLIFHYHILSYSTVFFTSKNGLIIILQWYRITVILATTISQGRRHQGGLVEVIQMNTNDKRSGTNESNRLSVEI
ncbi:unnamed protein product [Adineta ricciae]|uniref:Transmembrane protein 26 n=1 Tax=Adineta ricciae TaxID=249248 RepID=A0A814EHT4_ADIRI|nr:unnamed protein product [Adineta ricciae]